MCFKYNLLFKMLFLSFKSDLTIQFIYKHVKRYLIMDYFELVILILLSIISYLFGVRQAKINQQFEKDQKSNNYYQVTFSSRL